MDLSYKNIIKKVGLIHEFSKEKDFKKSKKGVFTGFFHISDIQIVYEMDKHETFYYIRPLGKK